MPNSDIDRLFINLTLLIPLSLRRRGGISERGEAPLLPILTLPLLREGGQGDRLLSNLILLGDKFFGIKGGGSPISGSGYGLSGRVTTYIASGKNTRYFGLHLIVGDDITALI